MSNKYYTTKEFMQITKIPKSTLYKYIKEGKITPYKLPNKQYRFTDEHIEQILNIHKNIADNHMKLNIIYARVSSQTQKKYIQNQIKYCKEFCIKNGIIINDIIYDISSSFNFNRPGLLKILKLLKENKINNLIVYSKDRLTRLAFDLFDNLFKIYNANIIVIDNSDIPIDELDRKDLIDELVSFIHYITSKIYGKRKYTKSKLKEIINEEIKKS